MQHKMTALALVGLAGVTLAGCGVQHHASSTQHHATPTKKVAQKNKTGNSVALSSKQAAQTSSSSDQGKKFAFPQNMQGTWYAVDSDDGSVHTLVIKGNELTEDGHTLQCMTMKAWTPEDESIINNPQAAQNTWKQDHWGKAQWMNAQGHRWVNVRGWYQSAGDGESYCLDQENVNGQNVPVILEAGGAMFTVDETYYRSQSLAKQAAAQSSSSQQPADQDDNDDD